MELKGKAHARFRRKLLAWYARHKRVMPWRGTRDAYRVWVSEIMLQQTRVAAVEPYYRKFVKKFPTVGALARARSEDVLKLWAGLGYYSRARNLHRAAREIVAKHAGRFPREYAAALELPGVGRYTAAAVLSIAYGEPLAVVDGNVARVLARSDAVRGDVREARRWKQLEERAQELMGTGKTKFETRNSKLESRAGEWNQAMMELGATLCAPRAPRCGECPVARWCKARARGIVEEIPGTRKKRAAVKVTLAAAVFLDGYGYTLLVNAGGADADGYFSRMWQFPAIEVRRNARAELQRHLKQALNFDAEKLQPLLAVRHSVTYRAITVRPFLILAGRLPKKKAARSAPLRGVERLAVSSATKKIARIAERSVAV